MHPSICILHIYWGEWPKWFSFFLRSCELNPEIKFLFLSDIEFPFEKKNNILVRKLSVSDFNKLASKKLNISINIKNPYKICDFKPAFGKIFEDYLFEYDFWGYCDNDLIFGNLSKYLDHKILTNYDVISFYKGFLSGPLCLYKNNKKTRALFLYGGVFKNIFLASDKHYGFDENIEYQSFKRFSLIKFLSLAFFILTELIKGNFTFKKINEIRYQFQWFYKKRLCLQKNNPLHMTDIVWKAQQRNYVRAYFNEWLLSDVHFLRNGINNCKLKWEDGTLYDLINKKEILGFHFIESKSKPNFLITDLMPQRLFYIKSDGIS
jgi:hypothetical protein